MAADYTAATEAELRQAVADANADGDPTSTIRLTGNITVTDSTAIAVTKPLTIDAGAFALSGTTGIGATGPGGNSLPLTGGAVTIAGSITGGAAAAANSLAVGGIGLVQNGGTITNRGTVTGGTGGNTSYSSPARRTAGIGGAGISATDGIVVNEAEGIIRGGGGGGYDAQGGTTSNPAGLPNFGGAGVVLQGGSLDNRGLIVGGASGDGSNLAPTTDNVFSQPGGAGAELAGGTHVNAGTILGGVGGIGANNGATGNGIGGIGVSLTNGAVLVNNGTLRGGDGRAGGGTVVGTGSAGGRGAAVSGSTLANTGSITGGDGTGTGAAAGAGGIGVEATQARIVNGGTIAAGIAGNGARATAIRFNGGGNVLEIRAGSVIVGDVMATASDTLSLGGAADGSFDMSAVGVTAQYRGFGLFEKTGTSTWTLTGSVSGSTPWTIRQGTLSVASDALLGNVAGTLTLDGGILRVTGTGFATSARPIVLGANGGGFDIADPGHGFTLAQSLGGPGAVAKLGAGRLILTGENTYAGGTTIGAGTLQIGDGGTTGSIQGNVLNDATLAFNRSDAVTFAGVVAGSGALRQDGAGTLTLTGESAYGGGTVISRGRLQIGDGGTTGSIQGDVLNDGILAFNRSDAVTFAGTISGSGALRQDGAGTLILTGENTYGGGTVISQGTLQIGDGGTTGSIQGDVLNDSLHSLVFNRSNTLTFAGVISGTGAVRQDGGGTTILAGANTYSGPTGVDRGRLQAGAARSFSPNSAVGVAAGAVLDLAGFDQTIAGLTNAGLVALRGAPGTVLTVHGNVVGQGGVIALNTVLAGDASPTDRLVIGGGSATGTTGLRIANLGGTGAQTVQGIRIVETQAGGTTAAGAFHLDTRAAAGAYEYLLFRGGNGDADGWYLRSASVPVAPAPGMTAPPAPAIPFYRPEVPLYAPIAGIGRQMGLATLASIGSLHERVGEEENIRGLTGSSPYANGAWARTFGERSRSRWDGDSPSRATGELIGLQAGFDIIRTQPYAGGHRDHAGVYVAYTNYDAPSVSGFALGRSDLRVGRLSLEGPTAGAYWTHFGPSGWYLDAVFQANWFDVKARSDFGTALSTNGTGYAASLEAGYPIRFGAAGRWQVEPQAQIVYQSVSVDRARDAFSSVDWDEDDAWTGRIGARVQYTAQTPEALWQPYAKVNLWHAFSGTDRISFGGGAPIASRFGNTALELGAGVTARVTQSLSFYGNADYRWSVDGDSRETAVQGTIGIRFNW